LAIEKRWKACPCWGVFLNIRQNGSFCLILEEDNTQNGILPTLQPARETKLTPSTTIWQGHFKTPHIDNDSYFMDLINKFGSRAEKAIKGAL
jgi:hypothetical protein